MSSTINANHLIECPKCGTPVEKPEGYNPKSKSKDNPKVYCHICWFDQWFKQDPQHLEEQQKQLQQQQRKQNKNNRS